MQSLKDKRMYIGFSKDLRRRLRDHQIGKNILTLNRRPLILLLYEAFLEESLARKRGRYFKTSKGKAALKIMLND